MGSLLETPPSIHCGQWVKYACDPGYSFADKVMENAKCMSIREGSLVGVYINKWDGGAKFIMPKCISSTDKHGKDNSLSIGNGNFGGILAVCLLVAAGICAYRQFLNRRRDERVSVRKSLKTKILRKTYVKPEGMGELIHSQMMGTLHLYQVINAIPVVTKVVIVLKGGRA